MSRPYRALTKNSAMLIWRFDSEEKLRAFISSEEFQAFNASLSNIALQAGARIELITRPKLEAGAKEKGRFG